MLPLFICQQVHGCIRSKGKLVPLAEPDAFMACKLQTSAKASNPGKQIQKRELCYLASPLSLGLIGTAVIFPLMLKKASGHL